MEVSNLTSKILAYKELPNFNMDDSIDWAMDMLSLGHETPSLLILAGLPKTSNWFETEKYLIESLQELNFKFPNRQEAIIQYCKYFLTKICNRQDVRNNLYQLYKIAQTVDDDRRIYEFYLLYWAWDDFDYDQTYSPYWEGATPSNIEQIVIDLAIKTLKT